MKVKSRATEDPAEMTSEIAKKNADPTASGKRTADEREHLSGTTSEAADPAETDSEEVNRTLGAVAAAAAIMLALAVVIFCVVIPVTRIMSETKDSGGRRKVVTTEETDTEEKKEATRIVMFGRPRGYEAAMEAMGGEENVQRCDLIGTDGPDLEEAYRAAAARRPENVVGTPLNYFYLPSNYSSNAEGVAVKPAYVRYDGERIIMDCYVIAGVPDDQRVYNIEVYKLSLRNEEGVIAEGSFGTLDSLLMSAGDVVTWTFTFEASEVLRSDANLTGTIYLDYDTAYDYHRR